MQHNIPTLYLIISFGIFPPVVLYGSLGVHMLIGYFSWATPTLVLYGGLAKTHAYWVSSVAVCWAIRMQPVLCNLYSNFCNFHGLHNF